MKTIQALAFLMIPLILVTSCALAESPGYPTIAEINELLENNRELFTRTAEILRGHPIFSGICTRRRANGESQVLMRNGLPNGNMNGLPSPLTKQRSRRFVPS